MVTNISVFILSIPPFFKIINYIYFPEKSHIYQPVIDLFFYFIFIIINKKVFNTLILIPLYLFVFGSLIGLLNIITSNNDFNFYVIYSALSFLHLISFIAGCICACKGTLVLYKILLYYSLFDILMAIPRYIHRGTELRSPLGASLLIVPVIIVILSKQSLFKHWLYYIIPLGIYNVISSGMRSSVVVFFSTLFMSFLYIRNPNIKRFVKLSSIFVILIIFSLFIPNARNIASKKINEVEGRLERTIFNRNNFQIDEDAGRVYESKIAVRSFYSSAELVDIIFGAGYGFTYSEGNDYKTHVHITYLAWFIRFGIVGQIIYVILFLSVIGYYFYFFFESRNSNSIILFSISTFCLSVLIMSLIAGSLIQSMPWFFLGILSQSKKIYNRNNENIELLLK